jgi:hypothetical protein
VLKKSVWINICNLIDHRRNPAITLRHFASRRKFFRYTRNGHFFHKEAAKGVIKGLLKRIGVRRRNAMN